MQKYKIYIPNLLLLRPGFVSADLRVNGKGLDRLVEPNTHKKP
jgi:hypothetical protein